MQPSYSRAGASRRRCCDPTQHAGAIACQRVCASGRPLAVAWCCSKEICSTESRRERRGRYCPSTVARYRQPSAAAERHHRRSDDPRRPTDAQISGGGKVIRRTSSLPERIAFIKPMIAMRNGNRAVAALYASSRSAQGVPQADFRLEMEGTAIQEIPMLAGSNPQLMQQALRRSAQ